MNARNLYEEIIAFSKLQCGLVEGVYKAHPGLVFSEFILDHPDYGNLIYEGQKWRYKKHGVGYYFENCDSGLVVDIAENINMPKVMNVWRLEAFLNSKKVNFDLNSVEESIKQLFAENKITSCPENGRNMFRLLPL